MAKALRIGIITPAPKNSRLGNRVTALRWQNILRRLGHRVTVAQSYEGEGYDLLVALHARRSYAAIRRFRLERPDAPLIVALTGTDLYRDLPRSRHAQKSLDLASRLIVLQPRALEDLRPDHRKKAGVIYQSNVLKPERSGGFAPPPGERAESDSMPARRYFDVCVVGHLRPVKDPFRAAIAARMLPANSRLRILHLGGAMARSFAIRARGEMRANPRYHWLGERSPGFLFRVLRRARLFVQSSRLEGGANALSEAVAAGVPILASRIPGNIGILGDDYPGYFNVGDAKALARLLRRAETDSEFLADLRTRCSRLAPLFEPRREEAAWATLLRELTPEPPSEPP